MVGFVVLFSAMDVGASAEIVTVPLLLIGLGMGGLASQLGSVTVSAVPDEKSPEVGGLQNTATQFGASLGTALAGSVLIAALTASFLTGIAQNPDVPKEVSSQASVELAAGVPFVSDADLEVGVAAGGRRPGDHPGHPGRERAGSRWTACARPSRSSRSSRVIALFFTKRIPGRQPDGVAATDSPPTG